MANFDSVSYSVSVEYQNKENEEDVEVPFYSCVGNKEAAEKLFQEKCLEYKDTKYDVLLVRTTQSTIQYQIGK